MADGDVTETSITYPRTRRIDSRRRHVVDNLMAILQTVPIQWNFNTEVQKSDIAYIYIQVRYDMMWYLIWYLWIDRILCSFTHNKWRAGRVRFTTLYTATIRLPAKALQCYCGEMSLPHIYYLARWNFVISVSHENNRSLFTPCKTIILLDDCV